jgi:hypothetical protein
MAILRELEVRYFGFDDPTLNMGQCFQALEKEQKYSLELFLIMATLL